jgi:GNAT superfamily N-acetyltransferase
VQVDIVSGAFDAGSAAAHRGYGRLIANGHVHVVDQDGLVQGLLVLIPEEDTMLLDNVAVVPSGQGSGLGRRMLEFAERAARDAGYHSIKLYTRRRAYGGFIWSSSWIDRAALGFSIPREPDASGLKNGTRNAKQASKKNTPPIRPSISPLRMLDAMKPIAEIINKAQPSS